MDITHIDIKFKGTGFSPKKLVELTGLPIEIIQEAGDKAKLGPEKGHPSSRGYGFIEIETHDNSDEKLSQYLDVLVAKKDLLPNSGLEKIIIDIEVPSNQFNSFLFSPEIISKIYLLNASVIFGNYESATEKIETREKVLEDFIFKHYHIKTEARKIPSSLVLKSFHQIYQDKSSKEVHALVEQVSLKAGAYMAMMLLIGVVAGVEKEEKKIETRLRNIFLNE